MSARADESARRWYRWSLPAEANVPSYLRSGYEYATSAANVQTTAWGQVHLCDERLEESDVKVRAVARPPLAWLRKEWTESLKAMDAAVDWHRFIVDECKALDP